MFLEISQNSQENTCARDSFIINFIKKESLGQVFFCEFCEISKSTFFIEHILTTDSDFYRFHRGPHQKKDDRRKPYTKRNVYIWTQWYYYHYYFDLPNFMDVSGWNNKELSSLSLEYFCKKSFIMFDWVPNTPLHLNYLATTLTIYSQVFMYCIPKAWSQLLKP